MSQNKKILKLINDKKEKYSMGLGTGSSQTFELVFNETKSKCRDIVLKYREEAPDVAPHIENVSNQILANIVSIKNRLDTESFKNQVRLDLIGDLERDMASLLVDEPEKKTKKKQDKREELEK